MSESASVTVVQRSGFKRLGMVAYRVSVVALLAIIALPHLRSMGDLPAAAGLQSGFTPGPLRGGGGGRVQQPAPLANNPPSALLTRYGLPTYGDAYPDYRDMLPRDLNGVPVVYVVNLPYIQGGRLGTVTADVNIKDIDWNAAHKMRP